MSAPLVVNTMDGTVWTRRGALRGGEPLYAPEGVCRCPEFVMATLAELAEHGIAGTAEVLPVPVGTEPQLTPERLAEIRDLLHYGSSIAFYSHRAKESILLLVAEAEEAVQLRSRIAGLERQLAAKDRPADEFPILYALTDKAVAAAEAGERQ
ncbi:hypothetical protein ACWHLZ_27870 [Streptomyces chartreusis]|uniref:hypothetical protein n=1 Tax=Streptomyces chartreusis TaxID=1969 RepID=UPI003420635C